MAAGSLSAPLTARAAYAPPQASIVVDAATGAVLSENRADEPRHPASLAKLITLLIVFDSLRNGNLTLDQKITISDNAASTDGGNLNLKAGDQITVEEAILAMTVKSANNVSVAMAEALSGSESGFAVIMNKKAQEAGMKRSHFTNASGLPDNAQITTARDMAVLARYILTDYKEFYPYFSRTEFTFRGQVIRGHNGLLNKGRIDGIKTGFILASGFNIVASTLRAGQRLIGVVFGGRSAPERDAEMDSLLSEAFKILATRQQAEEQAKEQARKEAQKEIPIAQDGGNVPPPSPAPEQPKPPSAPVPL